MEVNGKLEGGDDKSDSVSSSSSSMPRPRRQNSATVPTDGTENPGFTDDTVSEQTDF